jgi:hypothetical protein
VSNDPSFEELCKFFSYSPKNRLLMTPEAAEVLGIKPNTLEIKRSAGNGPKYIRPAGTKRVVYRESDLLLYLYSGHRRSTSQPVPAYA